MLSLLKNVLPNGVYSRLANAERAVSALPREVFEFTPASMYSSRGIGFNQAGEVRDRVGRGHPDQEKNVVGHTVDGKRNSAQFADDAAQAGMKIGPASLE